MIVENNKTPFYHTIIHDYFTPEERELIWDELETLHSKLEGPEVTGDPRASMLKRGLYLDHEYENRRNESNIFSISRKIFDLEKLGQLKENIFSKYLNVCNLDYTLLNYYPTQSNYKDHRDVSVLSSTICLWKEPKQFTGGNLFFKQYNYTPLMMNNSMILFPGFELHEILDTEVTKETFGRYAISQFYLING